MRHLWIALLLAGCKTNPPDQAQPVEPTVAAAPTAAEPAPVAEPAPTAEPTTACALESIYFQADADEPTAESAKALAEAVTCIKGLDDVQVVVEGHADESKGEEESLAIAERYTRTVRDALVAAGIPKDRIATMSYGRERPSCMEHTDECRAANRRCDLRTE